MKMLPRGETLFRKWTIAFTKYHFVEFDVVNGKVKKVFQNEPQFKKLRTNSVNPVKIFRKLTWQRHFLARLAKIILIGPIATFFKNFLENIL